MALVLAGLSGPLPDSQAVNVASAITNNTKELIIFIYFLADEDNNRVNPSFQGEAIVPRIRSSGFDIDQTCCKQLKQKLSASLNTVRIVAF
jgi:hypothetical protein